VQAWLDAGQQQRPTSQVAPIADIKQAKPDVTAKNKLLTEKYSSGHPADHARQLSMGTQHRQHPHLASAMSKL